VRRRDAQAHGAVGTGRIGFVYTERLMTESKLAKVADEKIQAEFSKRQKQVDEMVKRYKEMPREVRRRRAQAERHRPHPPHARAARHGKGRAAHAARVQRRPDPAQGEERAAIAQKAFKLIEQVAEQEKLDVVLQESAWTSPRIDITDKILKLLDK
jgi:outer membrane protein